MIGQLPPLSVFKARSTYAISAGVALFVASGALPAADAGETTTQLVGMSNAFWESAMQLGSAVCAIWAWWERRSPSRRLTLAEGAR